MNSVKTFFFNQYFFQSVLRKCTCNSLIIIFVFVGGPTGNLVHDSLITYDIGEWKKHIILLVHQMLRKIITIIDHSFECAIR